MPDSRRRLLLAPLALVALGLAAGCSDDQGGTTTTPRTPPPADPSGERVDPDSRSTETVPDAKPQPPRPKPKPSPKPGADVPPFAVPPSAETLAASDAASEKAGFQPVTADPPMYRNVRGKHGGTLVLGVPGELATLNPVVSSSATESEIYGIVFDTLVSYDAGRWIEEPALAHSWDHSDDWLTWTFHLRRGLKWSDGEAFDADDVLFSLDCVFHEKIANSHRDGFNVDNAGFPDYEKLDQYTVRFHLKAVDALFLIHLGNVRIVPQHPFADTLDPENPTFPSKMSAQSGLAEVIGTGPFRVVSYDAAEGVRLARNPYSWRRDAVGARLPYLDHIVIKFYDDLNTRSTAFLAGEFDSITDVPPPDYSRFKAKERGGAFRIHRLGLNLNTVWVAFNQHPGTDDEGKPVVTPYKLRWFQNPEFRRAISYATDRDNLVKNILDGKGEAIYVPTSPGNKTWFRETKTTPYDAAKANAMLDELGFADRDGDGVRDDADGNRLTIELMTNVENPTRVRVLNELKKDWAAIGVEADVKPVNFNELVHELQDGHKWEVILLGWGSAIPPDPLNGVNIHLSSGRLHVWYPMQPEPANEWERKADGLLNEMLQVPEQEKRQKLWGDYLDHFADGLPMLYLYVQNAYGASYSHVKGLRPTVLRPQTWHNAEELWIDGDE